MKLFSSADLRARLASSIALSLLVLMSTFSLWQYYRETQYIRTESEQSAQAISDVLIMGLKHAMLLHDEGMMQTMTQNIGDMGKIQRVILLNPQSVVKADSAANGNRLGKTLDANSAACSGCHSSSGNKTLNVLNNSSTDVLRIATPIANSPECYTCHQSSQKYLGILLVDISEQAEANLARQNAWLNLGLSVVTTLLIFTVVYLLLNFLAVRRIEAFIKPLNAYADGNYDARLPVSKAGDELDRLADTFNRMVAEIEMHISEEKKRGELLSHAIVEERERIARELHDSLPQLLAYLNTKIGAIYLFVEKGKKKDALDNLRELEAASHNLLTDVRDAIHGLRASRLLASGLNVAIRNYVDQFRELCRIPVTYSFDSQGENVQLLSEIQVQALRIVQEALSNIRKHSKATQASVQILFQHEELVLIIEDNGIGFEPLLSPSSKTSQYGLQTMRERAESLNGKFMIQSHSGKGTKVIVSLPISS